MHRIQQEIRLMRTLKTGVFAICISFLTSIYLQAAQKNTPVIYVDGKLDNGLVSVAINIQKGSISIHDSISGDILLSNARFKTPSGGPLAKVKVLKVQDIEDALGVGKKVILAATDWNLLRYSSHKASGKTPPPAPILIYIVSG